MEQNKTMREKIRQCCATECTELIIEGVSSPKVLEEIEQCGGHLRRLSIQNSPKLTQFKADDDFFKDFPFGINLFNMTHFELKDTGISELPSNFGEKWISLTDVRLYKNKIETFPDEFGKKWTELKILEISEEPLIEIPKGFGNTWTQLRTFSLKNTPLETLPDDFGETWTQLKKVILIQNDITELSDFFGETWTQLEAINLYQNQITELPYNFGDEWSHLREITIYEPKLNFKDLIYQEDQEELLKMRWPNASGSIHAGHYYRSLQFRPDVEKEKIDLDDRERERLGIYQSPGFLFRSY